MSIKNAQKIANEINAQHGIELTAFNNSDLEWLKSKLEEFLDLEVETDELEDPDFCEEDFESEEEDT